MAKAFSQETFNNAVLENIENLELSPEDAVQAAITQFESQGLDLSSIVKEPPTYFEDIEKEVEQLTVLNKSKGKNKANVIEKLTALKTECDKGLQYKVLFAQYGAYSIILDVLSKYESEDDVRKICIKALISLMTRQPDLLDDRGVKAIMSHLQKDVDLETRRLTLKWTKACCIMNELNRQNLFAAHILEPLKELLSEDSTDVLKETLTVCRALTLDDDSRVEVAKAQERSRLIASDTLCSIVGLLNRFQKDEELVNDLIITLCQLLVRAEYCRKVADAGGLETIKDIMLIFPSNEKINKHCFKLLKALAGDDGCKIHIIQKNFAPEITAALDANKANIPTTAAGLCCVAALSLRSPENSKEFFDSGIPEVIVNIMKMYPDDVLIQKSASWAVRNMVSRNKAQSQTYQALGIEKILLTDLKRFKDIEYDIKAALRDLGCHPA